VSNPLCETISNHKKNKTRINYSIVNLTLLQLPVNSNIYYNDLADLSAKNSIKDA